jgi:hypothetical protein
MRLRSKGRALWASGMRSKVPPSATPRRVGCDVLQYLELVVNFFERKCGISMCLTPWLKRRGKSDFQLFHPGCSERHFIAAPSVRRLFDLRQRKDERRGPQSPPQTSDKFSPSLCGLKATLRAQWAFRFWRFSTLL